MWDLPGGGLDFGESPSEALKREISEEMGRELLHMDDAPSYFVTAYGDRFDIWFSNIIYKAKISNLDNFTPSP